ncbi:hypothetical protein G3M48_000612 [Beauveria asiatica]|uniref:Uncharacterized protein n=1 Tax=Beauveria asiatica TaxID=1069075 RepID=A0AAW0S0H4_9HYPO
MALVDHCTTSTTRVIADGTSGASPSIGACFFQVCGADLLGLLLLWSLGVPFFIAKVWSTVGRAASFPRRPISLPQYGEISRMCQGLEADLGAGRSGRLFRYM